MNRYIYKNVTVGAYNKVYLNLCFSLDSCKRTTYFVLTCSKHCAYCSRWRKIKEGKLRDTDFTISLFLHYLTMTTNGCFDLRRTWAYSSDLNRSVSYHNPIATSQGSVIWIVSAYVFGRVAIGDNKKKQLSMVQISALANNYPCHFIRLLKKP